MQLLVRTSTFTYAASHDVYAAGYNAFGQLGLNDTSPRSNFTKIPQLSGIGARTVGGTLFSVVSAGKIPVLTISDWRDLCVWIQLRRSIGLG